MFSLETALPNGIVRLHERNVWNLLAYKWSSMLEKEWYRVGWNYLIEVCLPIS